MVRVVLTKRARVSPGASGCRVQVPGDVPGLEYALRAFWRCQPRRNWFSLGLSAHLTRMARYPAVDIKSHSQRTPRANMA